MKKQLNEVLKEMSYLMSYDRSKTLMEQVGNIDGVGTPMEKMGGLLYTKERKVVIFEGVGYSTETGDIIPLNEGWTLSDVLHAGADVVSAGMDFVVPGSGAAVDVLNALSYIIEAQFKASGEEKDSLYLMAAITFAFVVLPGPLQAVAIPLKRAIKTGTGFATKSVMKGVKMVSDIWKTVSPKYRD
jgi:hypothetical protein